ncbi:hypothetical protein FHS95_003787 [Sphingomonas naasensis]|uniref:Uncharacterized protein n=1 Tax=Sphingomonas naasensis TaxID=1344951 RepID=A0A4S1WKE9_9SPHN|nr:hypothetical protein [Sphingomonas naasensis]NIJ22076.1 hypothetical protein [Sphingomonas naasensis]TGX42250.1 hypothetical protein E5A74_10350 [Sphingomonas naasensis]
MIALAMTLAIASGGADQLVPGGEEEVGAAIAGARRCDSSGDEVVICRRSDKEQFRLEKIEPRYREAPVRATRRLGPGELSVEAEQRELPGAGAPAAMLRFRIPLGRGQKK